MTDRSNNTYTAYVVREENSRRFLSRPAYSGRIRGLWGAKEFATVFYDRRQAQSCASNINARRPAGYSTYHAQVQPVIFERRTPKTR